MYIAIEERERDALQGADYALTVLYMYLKSFMDYKTGIVGYARRISYQSISEAMYIEPRAGVKGGSPHISSIRRMIDQLIKLGIIKKSRKDTLVFKLVYADTENYNQNKADRKSTPIADSPRASIEAVISPKADRPKKVKADTPHLSLNTITNPPSSINNLTHENDDDEKLIFHKSLHQDITAAMQNQLKGFQHERKQELLDELSFYISKNKISVSPMSLFLVMVKGAKAGTFIAANAHSVKKSREASQAQAAVLPKAELTAEEKAANKEKGREAMKKVTSIFGKRKTAA